MKEALKTLFQAEEQYERLRRMEEDLCAARQAAGRDVWRKWLVVAGFKTSWPEKSLEELTELRAIVTELGWQDYQTDDACHLLCDLDELIIEKEKDRAHDSDHH